MHADRGGGESKQCRWRGGTASAIAVVLCALAGAPGLIAPPPATAMTNEELATICSSVFSEIGDLSICTNNFPSSEGTGGGSYATEPSPGVIVILDSKPDPNRVSCGSGIDAARLVDCHKRRRADQGLGFTGGGKPQVVEPRTILPGEKRQASGQDSVKRCILAQMTLSAYHDAVKFLRKLQNNPHAWGPEGNFLDPNEQSRLVGKWNGGWQAWFTPEIMRALAEKFPDFGNDPDYHYLNVVRAGWEMLRNDAEKDLRSPTCMRIAKAKS